MKIGPVEITVEDIVSTVRYLWNPIKEIMFMNIPVWLFIILTIMVYFYLYRQAKSNYEGDIAFDKLFSFMRGRIFEVTERCYTLQNIDEKQKNELLKTIRSDDSFYGQAGAFFPKNENAPIWYKPYTWRLF